MSLQPVVHYSLHILLPGAVAYIFFSNQWKKAWLIMLLTMVVDLDHFWSWPEVFVADRCSIGFHPLHSYPAILLYAIMWFFPKVRIVALGLLLHMLTDWQDCLWM